MGEQWAAGSLGGRVVAVLQTRHHAVLAALIERHGGVSYLAPCMREVAIDDRVPLRAALERLAQTGLELAIFQTGVGTAALFDFAMELGQDRMLAQRLAGATVLERGPKPLAVLLKRGVRVDRRTVEPHTTVEVMALVDKDLSGRTVLLQHYGAPNQVLVNFLRNRGAQVLEVTTYGWSLPQDLAPVRRFLADLPNRRVDATTFTSASQVENLFQIAEQDGCGAQLAGWLSERSVVASIGPVCTRALSEHGVRVRVEPDRPKMVPLVKALCEYFLVGLGPEPSVK